MIDHPRYSNMCCTPFSRFLKISRKSDQTNNISVYTLAGGDEVSFAELLVFEEFDVALLIKLNGGNIGGGGGKEN